MITNENGKRVLTKEDKKMLGYVKWYCGDILNKRCDDCVFRDFLGCPLDAANGLLPKKKEGRKVVK